MLLQMFIFAENGGRLEKPAGPLEKMQEESLSRKCEKTLISREIKVFYGAADGSRTRTPIGHKHLKLASLPIPAQPQMATLADRSFII